MFMLIDMQIQRLKERSQMLSICECPDAAELARNVFASKRTGSTRRRPNMQQISEWPNMQPISEVVVRCLAEYRHHSGKTLRKLGEEMEWDHADISRIESRKKPPSIPFIEQAFGYLITKTKKNIAENGGL